MPSAYDFFSYIRKKLKTMSAAAASAKGQSQRGQSESRFVARPGRERTGKRGAGARAHEGQERTWKRGREGMHAMLRAGFVGV
jgi:hypothetical protein